MDGRRVGVKRALGKQLWPIVVRARSAAFSPFYHFLSGLSIDGLLPSSLSPPLRSEQLVRPLGRAAARPWDVRGPVRSPARPLTFAIHFDYFICDIEPNTGRLGCNFESCKTNGKATKRTNMEHNIPYFKSVPIECPVLKIRIEFATELRSQASVHWRCRSRPSASTVHIFWFWPLLYQIFPDSGGGRGRCE